MSSENSNCPELPPPTPIQILSTMADLAESMGANETCKKIAKDSVKSGQSIIDEGSSLGWGLTEENVATETEYQNTLRSLEQSGCGAISINASNITSNINNMQCIIKKSMLESSATAVASASINIETIPLTDAQTKTMEKVVKSFEILATGKSVEDTISLYNAFMKPFNRDIDLSDAKLSQKVTGSVKTSLSLSEESKTEIANIQKEIAKSVTESVLSSELGSSASDPNTKSIIENNETINKNTSVTDIDEKSKKITASVSASGSIDIVAGGNIDMSSIVVDQDIVANLISDVLIKDAIQTGMLASSDVLRDAKTSNVTENESAGTEVLLDELTQDMSVEVNDEDGSGGMSLFNLLLLFGVAVALYLIFKKYYN